jgi:hypothetical protein
MEEKNRSGEINEAHENHKVRTRILTSGGQKEARTSIPMKSLVQILIPKLVKSLVHIFIPKLESKQVK